VAVVLDLEDLQPAEAGPAQFGVERSGRLPGRLDGDEGVADDLTSEVEPLALGHVGCARDMRHG
jgi:hypothetical protein